METNTPTPFLNRKIVPGLTVATLLVLALMALSAGLHLYNIQSIGNANEYYTAAVQSMLQSWSNFFFVAAEPGGSVTVDKPPLGLWVEAIFAFFLGISGFSTSLPNILGGVLGVPLLYSMVRKYLGELAGLVAALVMTITPVLLATNRNNTMDGLLVFTLLLAAWAFISATETGKARWLMFGAFIVGLGFNIKMLQAFLPLPAFYALYFLGSREGWLRKTIQLGLATLLLAAVSLSWAVAVDLVPAENRPYIGSSGNNTVMGLIFGHNGASRLGNNMAGFPNQPDGNGAKPPVAGSPLNGQNPNPQQGNRPRNNPPAEALQACQGKTQGDACSFTERNGNNISGSCITPPQTDQLACAPVGMNPPGGPGQQDGPRVGPGGPNGQGGGTPFSQETGSPGIFRFFTQPLSRQMSWLLPFALASILLALFAAKIRLPVESGAHKAVILWGGWLLTCVVFFSIVSGIFHAYYAIMLAPALGATVGLGVAMLEGWARQKPWANFLLLGLVLLTLGFQLFAAWQYNVWTVWYALAGILLLGGLILLFIEKRFARLALAAAMLVIPAYWSILTVSGSADHNLPTAYTGQNGRDDGLARPAQRPGNSLNAQLLGYLQANTAGVKYLLAVPSSQSGASLVIATGRPVLYMGGFGGQDEVVSADDLAKMVANGELRYVLYGNERGDKPEISTWLQNSCQPVPEFSGQSGAQNMTLYQCK